MGATLSVAEACSVVRTKNAGPFLITCDLIFKDEETYKQVTEQRLITAETVAEAYGIPLEDVVVFEVADEVRAIKASIRRRIPSGHRGDSDCYGMNQEAPLLGIIIESP